MAALAPSQDALHQLKALEVAVLWYKLRLQEHLLKLPCNSVTVLRVGRFPVPGGAAGAFRFLVT